MLLVRLLGSPHKGIDDLSDQGNAKEIKEKPRRIPTQNIQDKGQKSIR